MGEEWRASVSPARRRRAHSARPLLMTDKALSTWVSDQLHCLLGYSQSYLADFVVSLAKQERTAHGLFAKLGEADVPDTPASRRFASELFAKVPRGGSGTAGSGG